MAGTHRREDLLPDTEAGGWLTSAALALLFHLLLVGALSLGLKWKSRTPDTVEAELWAVVPQAAAPKAVEPPPPPPARPEPRIAPRAKLPDADIALEKEKARRAEAEKREQQKKEQALRKKREEEARRKAAEEEKQLEALRQENLKRIQGLAQGTGTPDDQGKAERSAAQDAAYAGRIKARIKPNIVFTDTVEGNPTAEVEVRAALDGIIVSRRIVKSSGVPAWDDAVLRAIDKTEVLPRDIDGRVPPSILITFRPKD